jgi:hypothetical protein
MWPLMILHTKSRITPQCPLEIDEVPDAVRVFVCCARYARTAEAVSNQDDLVTSAFGRAAQVHGRTASAAFDANNPTLT